MASSRANQTIADFKSKLIGGGAALIYLKLN